MFCCVAIVCFKSYERRFYRCVSLPARIVVLLLRLARCRWEAYDMGRKFLLVAGLALLESGSTTQLVVAQLVCFAYVVAIVNFAPYKTADTDFSNQV